MAESTTTKVALISVDRNISILVAIGLLLCSYALYVELKHDQDRSYKAMCDINAAISCTSVMTSDWGRGFGILPEALSFRNPIYGFIFYIVLYLLMIWKPGSIILVYNNSLNCDFTFDDNSAIVLNRHIHTNVTQWWKLFDVDYWGTPIKSEHSHKSYRPITSLTFRWNYSLDGLNPYGYHMFNIILHILVSFICFKFIVIILGPANDNVCPSTLFTLFFACHPLKSEAVTSIVGRAELLSTLFVLISLFCYFDSSYINFCLFVILASLSKEQGMTTPCICMVIEFIKLYLHYRNLPNGTFLERIFNTFRNVSLVKLICLIIFTLTIVGLRILIMGSSLPIFTKFDNPASFEETPIRQLTYNYLLPLNAKLILYPQWLCADWTMNSIPLVKDFDDPRNIWTAVFYLVTLMITVRSIMELLRREKHRYGKNELNNEKVSLVVALIMIVIPFIPASNLLFPVGFVIAERVLYTPSIGYSLLLAIGWTHMRNRFPYKAIRILLNLSTIVMLASLALRTYERNFDWKNDLTLFMSGLEVNPNNAKLYNNIGHYYERNSQFEKAIEYFKMAAQKDVQDIGSELNIARSLIRLNKLKEAEELLWNIKPRVRNSILKNRMVPQYLNIWLNLGHVISLNESRLHEAENLYLEVISIKSDFVDAYINLGELYIRRSLYDQALDTYQTALEKAEFISEFKTADLYYNIAVAKSLKMDNSETSTAVKRKIFNEIAYNLIRAIKINSEHKEALINLAILLQKPDFPAENQTNYRQFVVVAMKDYSKSSELESFQFNIAITLLDLGGPDNRLDAIKHFKRAAEIKPDFRSALYNLALLYYDFKDYDQSLFYLNQTLTHHSNYTKALLLTADIYSRLGRMDDTEKTYSRVLEKDKDNFEALHNLCQIYKKTKRKKEVEKCRLMLNDFNNLKML